MLDSNLGKCLWSGVMDPGLDSLTQIAVELIATEMLILVERQASSQLPGGKHWSPTRSLQKSSSNVPKTNVVGEGIWWCWITCFEKSLEYHLPT